MKYAVIGVIKNFGADGPEAVVCIKEGFSTRAEATQFAAVYFPTDERKARYEEIYAESYGSDAWTPDGGRCFYYARRALAENHAVLESYCGRHEMPCYVTAECDLNGPDGKPVRGKHGWVEAGDNVFDCGSYYYQMKRQERAAYYASKKPSRVQRMTLKELQEAADQEQ